MYNLIKADLFRIGKDRIWTAVIILLLILFTIPSIYTLNPMGGGSTFDQGYDVGEFVESRLPDYGVESTYELTTEQYREIIFSIDGYKTDIDIICGAFFPLFEVIIILEVLLVTRDFSLHSIKNTLSSQVGRKTYYFAKYLLLLAISSILLWGTNLTVWGCNCLINGAERSIPFGYLILYSALMMLPLTVFVTLVHAAAFIIRKSLQFTLVTMGLTLLTGNLLLNILMLIGGKGSAILKVLKYTLSFMYSEIVCTHYDDHLPYLYTCIPLCVIVTAVSLTGGYLFFKNREIK